VPAAQVASEPVSSRGPSAWPAFKAVGDYRRSGTDGYAAQVTGTVSRLTGRPARSLDGLLGEIAPGLSS
jgi:hypothetical protein